MNKKNIPESICREMYKMYEQGISLKKIGEEFKYSVYVIKHRFEEHGWKIRSKFDPIYNTYKYDYHYFDNIDTPNKAYLIGLLYADGYNNERGFSIELQDRDIEVLYGIKNLLGYSGEIKKYHRSIEKNNKSDTCKLSINSCYMSEKLTQLGCVRKKSLILDFPDWITEDLFPFFLKGYIDGDGWIQKYRIGFMSTDKFCDGVQTFLLDYYGIESKIYSNKGHYNEHTKTFDITNRKNIIPLVEMMFSEPTIGIPRKTNRYIEYGFLKNNSLSA